VAKAKQVAEHAEPEDIEDDVLDESEIEEGLDDLIQESDAGYEVADDEVDIDLSEAVSFEPFTGTVPAEVVKATLTHGQASKKPYIELRLQVTEGEFEKRMLFYNINLTGKGAGFAGEALRILGYPIDPKRPKVSPKRLVGAKCNAVCAPDEREEFAHKVVVKRLKPLTAADTSGVK